MSVSWTATHPNGSVAHQVLDGVGGVIEVEQRLVEPPYVPVGAVAPGTVDEPLVQPGGHRSVRRTGQGAEVGGAEPAVDEQAPEA